MKRCIIALGLLVCSIMSFVQAMDMDNKIKAILADTSNFNDPFCTNRRDGEDDANYSNSRLFIVYHNENNDNNVAEGAKRTDYDLISSLRNNQLRESSIGIKAATRIEYTIDTTNIFEKIYKKGWKDKQSNSTKDIRTVSKQIFAENPMDPVSKEEHKRMDGKQLASAEIAILFKGKSFKTIQVEPRRDVYFNMALALEKIYTAGYNSENILSENSTVPNINEKPAYSPTPDTTAAKKTFTGFSAIFNRRVFYIATTAFGLGFGLGAFATYYCVKKEVPSWFKTPFSFLMRK